jgi:hypothetical protein
MYRKNACHNIHDSKNATNCDDHLLRSAILEQLRLILITLCKNIQTLLEFYHTVLAAVTPVFWHIRILTFIKYWNTKYYFQYWWSNLEIVLDHIYSEYMSYTYVWNVKSYIFMIPVCSIIQLRTSPIVTLWSCEKCCSEQTWKTCEKRHTCDIMNCTARSVWNRWHTHIKYF